MRTIIETGLFLSGGFLISILQGLILIPNILLISYKKRLFDQPDERKVHSIPVPRLEVSLSSRRYSCRSV